MTWLSEFLEDLFSTLILFFCPECKNLADHSHDCSFGYQITLMNIYRPPKPLIIQTDEGDIYVYPMDSDSYAPGTSEFELKLKLED